MGGMNGPYREVAVTHAEPRRMLDPWKLALLFAWVCDIGRIGLGLLDGRSVAGELGFATLLGVTTVIVAVVSVRTRPAKPPELEKALRRLPSPERGN
jgi:hypothetical protein